MWYIVTVLFLVIFLVVADNVSEETDTEIGRIFESEVSEIETEQAERSQRAISNGCANSEVCAIGCQRRCGVWVSGWCDRKRRHCICVYSLVLNLYSNTWNRFQNKEDIFL